MPRPNVSAINNIIAPINADAGSKYLAFSPVSRLAICGASKPIKPIEPTTATQLPASATAVKIRMNLSRFAFSPRPCASSSPSDIRSSFGMSMQTIGKRIKSHGASSLTSSQFLPQRLPVSQMSAAFTSPGNFTIIYCIPAWQTAPKAMPDKASEEG